MKKREGKSFILNMRKYLGGIIMVKIINYEKEKIEEKRKQIEEEINKKNKEVRKHNSIIWTIYLFAIMALGAGLFCSIKYIHFD